MPTTPIPPDETPDTTHEHCLLTPHFPANPKRVGHAFCVFWEEYKDGPAFCGFEIQIDCNRYAQLFINSHPQWKRNCIPFILGELKAYLLELKTIEVPLGPPTIIEGGVTDSGDERIYLSFKITAQILNPKRIQNWLLPIANMAAHIDDQMVRFYQTHPECIPSPSRMGKVLAEHREKVLKLAHEKQSRQNAEYAKIRPANGKWLLFADESGDPGFKDWFSSYITVVCCIEEDKVPLVRKDLNALLKKHWPSPPPEIHFSKISKEKREALTVDLAQCIKEHGIKVYCFEAIKVNYLKYLVRCEAELNKDDETPVKTNIIEMTKDAKANVIFNFLSLSIEEIVGHIGSEALSAARNVHIIHDRKHRSWMNEAIEGGVKKGAELIRSFSEGKYGHKIAPTINCEIKPSHQEPCLWLSDWIANEVGNWNKGVEFSPALESCIGSFIFIGYDQAGIKSGTYRPGTLSHIQFPDIPRQIYRGAGAPELPADDEKTGLGTSPSGA